MLCVKHVLQITFVPHLSQAVLVVLCQDKQNIRETQLASHIHHKMHKTLIELFFFFLSCLHISERAGNVVFHPLQVFILDKLEKEDKKKGNTAIC